MKMLLKNTAETTFTTTTTGATYDRINLKHAVKMLIKSKTLPNSFASERGYIAVNAIHSGQTYLISKGGVVNNAWVKKLAADKGTECVWCGEIENRACAVIK